MAVDLSQQHDLDADWKWRRKLIFFWQLDKLNDNSNTTDAGADQNMFVLAVLEKNKTKISARKCGSFKRDDELWRSDS